jgi:hypothetical protein
MSRPLEVAVTTIEQKERSVITVVCVEKGALREGTIATKAYLQGAATALYPASSGLQKADLRIT